MNELGFVFHSENCIQCHACEVACKSWRGLEHGVKWRRVCNLWHGNYPDTSISTLSVSCMHCTVPSCVAACPAGAIWKREEDGLVNVDSDLCTGCRKCHEACPVGAPQFGTDGKMQKCDFCASVSSFSEIRAICTLACPTQALEQAQINPDQKAGMEKSIVENFRKKEADYQN